MTLRSRRSKPRARRSAPFAAACPSASAPAARPKNSSRSSATRSRAASCATSAAPAPRSRPRSRRGRSDIPLFALAEIAPLDLAVDGADEIDAQLRLIKGRGGALLREKIVEQQAKRFIVIADESKIVERLGVGVLPVEVTPFARDVLEKRFATMGLAPVLRLRDGQPRITDEGHLILDVRVPERTDIAEVVTDIRQLAGVVETGFFPTEATEALDRHREWRAANDASVSRRRLPRRGAHRRSASSFPPVDPDRLDVADRLAGADAVAEGQQRVDDRLRRAGLLVRDLLGDGLLRETRRGDGVGGCAIEDEHDRAGSARSSSGSSAPPGVPIARSGLPPRSTITGDSGEAGRLPPRERVRAAGVAVKSFIALLSAKPRPGTMKPLPASSPTDVVSETTLPCASTIETCVVCAGGVAAAPGSASATVGVTRFGSIDARQSAARSSERRSCSGTRPAAGSAEELVAIDGGAALGFGEQVNVVRPRQIEAADDFQNLADHESARGRRRDGVDVRAAKRDAHRRAPDRFVVAQIAKREVPPAASRLDELVRRSRRRRNRARPVRRGVAASSRGRLWRGAARARSARATDAIRIARASRRVRPRIPAPPPPARR